MTRSWLWLPLAVLGFCLPALAQPGPILWYDFEDGVSPTANLGSLGPSFNGAFTGDTVFSAFDGGLGAEMFANEDHVLPVAADVSAMNFADNDFTIEALFSTTLSEPGITAVRLLVTKEATGSEPAYGLAVRRGTGRVVLYMCDGVGCVAVESLDPINDGVPHLVRVVRDGDFLRLYVDEVLNAVTCIPEDFGSTANTEPFVIGGRTAAVSTGSPTTGPFDDFSGILGEVKIFDYATITVPLATGFRRGDCNVDGAMDISDAVTGLGALFSGGGPLRCEDSCDANDDGALDIADMVFVLDNLFVGGPTPPAPFGACGVDPTDDDLCCEFYPTCP